MIGKKPGRPPKNKTASNPDQTENDDITSQTDMDLNETEIIGGAVGGIPTEPETGISGIQGQQGRDRLGSEFSSLLRTIERGPESRNERSLANSQEISSPRLSRPNSPQENMARLHQQYLDRFEALGARQSVFEKNMEKMGELLLEINTKLNNDGTSVIQSRNNTSETRPYVGHSGDFSMGVDQNAGGSRTGNTGTVPKRNLRDISQINGNISRSQIETEPADNFGQFYDQNRPNSGPPGMLYTPVNRNETYRYEKMTEDRERRRNEILNESQNNQNSNSDHITYRASLERNSFGGSRHESYNTRSGPQDNFQNYRQVDNGQVEPRHNINESENAGRILRNCPEWSGPNSGVTFRQWMNSMRNRLLFGNCLGDKWKKVIIYEKLTETALTIAGEDMNPGIETNLSILNCSFEEYIKKLAEKLDPAQNLQRLKDQLESRKQRPDEPIDFYILSITNQWKKIYTPAEQTRNEVREVLCKLYKNSLVNPLLRKKAREFHQYVNPPNDYDQLSKVIMNEARLVREMVSAGDLEPDKQVGALEQLDYEMYNTKFSKVSTGKLNSIDIETAEESINFVKKDWKNGYKPYQKKRFFKPTMRIARLKNQNIGMKGRCFWCGDESHFVRDCPRKAKGLDRTVNGVDLEQECKEKGFEIDDEGLICAWITNDDEANMKPISFDSEPEINVIDAQNHKNWKMNNKSRFQGKKKGGYFRKRNMKVKKNNQFRTVSVISHFDEDDNLLEEIIEEQDETQGKSEIQSLDLNDIFESNFSLGVLDCNDEINEEIFTELDQIENGLDNGINESNLEENFSNEFFITDSVSNCEENLDDLSQFVNEGDRPSLQDCEKLEKYF